MLSFKLFYRCTERIQSLVIHPISRLQRGKWELGSWPACLHVFTTKLDRWVKIGAISLYEFRAQWEEWLQHGCATLIGTSFMWKITTISQKEEEEIPSKSLKGQKLNIYFTFHLLTIGLLSEEIWEICLPLSNLFHILCHRLLWLIESIYIAPRLP